MEKQSYNFRDDYSDGAHPDVLAAIATASTRSQIPYGEDEYTKSAENLILGEMNFPDSAVYFVAGGTLANLIMIGSSLRSHEAVIAVSTGHIVTRETGAIEATGHKIISVQPVEGKLTPEGISKALSDNSHGPHMAKPRLVYISNATEVGTIYTRAELCALSKLCKKHCLLLLLDGARLGVALSAKKNDLSFEDLTQLTDMFWIGGTKAGTLFGEAIVINNPELKEDFKYHVKQRGGLLAKGQGLGLQFQELFRNNLFFKLSAHANHAAKALSDGIQKAGFALADITETNQVFPILPNSLIAELQKSFSFYVWEKLDVNQSVIRLVTSWATDFGQVEAFIEAIESSSTNKD